MPDAKVVDFQTEALGACANRLPPLGKSGKNCSPLPAATRARQRKYTPPFWLCWMLTGWII
jgi:hypothetical protein